MLTCLVDNQVKRIFETEEQILRKWSKNGDMTCCGCGERITYNHGEIRDFVYLRHFRLSDNCDYEKDCEHHDLGKIQIFEYLKSIDILKNVDIEKRISETNQIADIYFEYNNRKIVVEYQCTPIATPLLQRSRKYQEAGYEVLWIFGVENYNIKNFIKQYKIDENIKNYKTIASEREILFGWDSPIIYYNPQAKQFYQICFNSVNSIIKRTTMFDFNIKIISLDDFNIIDFIDYKPYDNAKNNIINWIKNNNDLKIFNFIAKREYINPVVCFQFEDIKYSIEYIRKLLTQDEYNKIVSEYKKHKIIPIIFLDSKLYRINPNTDYISYSIIDKYYYNAENSNLSILSFYKTETWCSYYGSSYNMQVYNVSTSNLKDCFISGNNIENSNSSLLSFQNVIKSTIIKNENFSKEILKQQYKILEEVKENKLLNTEIIFVDGNYDIDSFITIKFNDLFNDYHRNFTFSELRRKIKYENKDIIYVLINQTICGQSVSSNRRKYALNVLREYGFKNVKFLGGTDAN